MCRVRPAALSFYGVFAPRFIALTATLPLIAAPWCGSVALAAYRYATPLLYCVLFDQVATQADTIPTDAVLPICAGFTEGCRVIRFVSPLPSGNTLPGGNQL